MKGETLEEYWGCTEHALDFGRPRTDPDPGRWRRRHLARPQGRGVRGGEERARPVPADSEEYAVVLGSSTRAPPRTPAAGPDRRGIHGVTEETTTGVHRLNEMEEPGAAVPRHQRERRGDEVEVRQPLRLPPLARRRHHPRHRRPDGREAGRGVRLWRRGQGLRRVAARPGRPRGGDRDRPDLRPPGRHGGLRGGAPRGRA